MDNSKEKTIGCVTEETSGFDVQAGLSWIYPTNYPLRDYQFNIIEQALYKNTLVCLPTGLGKTFIAAVVMYNFYRWYPTGKIVFMAPTKPLVKQQVEACYNIMAIPKDVTAELTGNQQHATRNEVWTERRVFFVTPQVLQNDLDSFGDLGAAIKCIVFDEAHKARGNYAYCEVMRKLLRHSRYFRVLALSATPGNSIDDVGEVINNLAISHMEFRTEESVDVKPYAFQRKLETVIVALDEKLEQVKEDYSQILEKYARTLIKHKILQGNCSTLNKGKIFAVKREFQARHTVNKPPNYNEVMKTLNICMTLYHAYELLIRHGLRGFLSFYEDHSDKALLRGNMALLRVLDDVKDYLGPLPNIDPLPDGSHPEVPMNLKFGHPKFYKLRDILLSHFTNSEDNTRVIVFFEYRNSVMEAFLALLQARPLIRAKIFLGQKSGVTQRVQINVIKSFREGSCNTLLSTCIGEEGLDVGEVDLIVCFDISNKSPIRMVQRMGRTGRKREGRVVVLVTVGKEQQTLDECLYQKNNMKNWAGSTRIMQRFFVESPRMVPENIMPECVKMQIAVRRPDVKKNNLKEMLKSLTGESSSSCLDDVEIVEIKERIPECLSLFNKSLSYINNYDFKSSLEKNIEKQRVIQGNGKIKASIDSDTLVNLLKYGDSKRFNIPLTQDGNQSNKNLKQGDIRSMFTKVNNKETPPPSQDFMTQNQLQNSQNLNQIVASFDELYKELYIEIANYLSIELTLNKQCEICSQLFECNVRSVENEDFPMETLKSWEIPEFHNDEITLETLEMYEKSLLNEPDPVEDSILQLIDAKDLSDLLADKIAEKSFKFDAPKSFNKLLNAYRIDEIDTQVELLKFFKLDKIEDIYEDLDETIIYSRSPSPVYNFENYPLSPVLSQLGRKKMLEVREPSSPVLKVRNSSQNGRIFEKSLKFEHQGHSAGKSLNFDGREEKFKENLLEKKILLNSRRNENRISIEENVEKVKNSNKGNDKISKGEQVLGENYTKKSLNSNDGKDGVENIIAKRFDEKSLDYGWKENESREDFRGINEESINSTGRDEKWRKEKEIPHEFRSLRGYDIGTFETHKSPNSRGRRNSGTSEGETVEKSPNYDKKLAPGEENLLEMKEKSLNFNAGDEKLTKNSLEKKISQNSINIGEYEDGGIFPENILEESFVDEFTSLNKENDKKSGEINASKRKYAGKFLDLNEGKDGGIFDNGNNIQRKFDGKSLDYKKESVSKEGLTEMRGISVNFNKRYEEEALRREILWKMEMEIPKKSKYSRDKEGVEIPNEKRTSGTSKGKKIVRKSQILNGRKDSETSEEENLLGIYGKRKKSETTEALQIDDLCDLSAFGLKEKTQEKSQKTQNFQIDDLCDESMLFNAESNTRIEPEKLGSSQKENASFEIDDICDISTFGLTQKEENTLNFDRFNAHLSDENMSTQREFEEKKVENIENSPDKNVIDLTDSPEKTQKRKILSQMSITQILSLAAKPTQEKSPFKSPKIQRKPTKKIVQEKPNIKKPTPSCSFSIDDSDDEFEDTSFISKSFNKTMRNFENELQPQKKIAAKKKIENKTKKQCEFVEYEAEVSIDGNSISSDENSEDGPFDQSFVDDESQNFANDTQTHVNYIRSIKSPRNPKFKIPTAIRPITADIFSQPPNSEENSYVNDSFCVNTQDVEDESHELTELEILEFKLKEMRKNKRKRVVDKVKENKRKRILIASDSDNSDN